MDNELQIFRSPEFGEVRTAGTPQEPLFCAADVCRALGYANGRDAVTKHCEEDDVAKRYPITDSMGRTQEATFVTESGLYSLIFGSKLEKAKAFKRWVTSEVLPSIRKSGGYIAEKAGETPEELMARALMIANETLNRKEERIKQLESAHAADKPYADFGRALVASETSCLIGELAKIITQNGKPIGQNKLFEWLRAEGFLGTKGENYNIPMQRYIEQGLFELKKGVRSGNDGVMHTFVTPKVTQKGCAYFIQRFKAA